MDRQGIQQEDTMLSAWYRPASTQPRWRRLGNGTPENSNAVKRDSSGAQVDHHVFATEQLGGGEASAVPPAASQAATRHSPNTACASLACMRVWTTASIPMSLVVSYGSRACTCPTVLSDRSSVLRSCHTENLPTQSSTYAQWECIDSTAQRPERARRSNTCIDPPRTNCGSLCPSYVHASLVVRFQGVHTPRFTHIGSTLPTSLFFSTGWTQ